MNEDATPKVYQCKTPPIGHRKDQRVIFEAKSLIRQWREDSPGSRPYVRVKFLGRKGRVFIDDFHYHFDKGKRLRDRVGRYRLVPCVQELLKNTTAEPVITENGNLLLFGATPDGQRFCVIVRPEKKGGALQSFYTG